MKPQLFLNYIDLGINVAYYKDVQQNIFGGGP